MTKLTKFQQMLHDQIKNEFTASQQYTAVAVYYDDADLPQLARYFYTQASDERKHAMMIIRYFLDRDLPVTVPSIGDFISSFDNYHAPLVLAYEQEKTVTDQFVALSHAAREEGDLIGEQFLLWFLQEQVEEVSNMSTLIKVSERSKGNTFDLEYFVSREFPKSHNNSPAPAAAGE